MSHSINQMAHGQVTNKFAFIGSVDLCCMNFVQTKRILIKALICRPSGSKSKSSNEEQDAFRQNPLGSACASFLRLYHSFM